MPSSTLELDVGRPDGAEDDRRELNARRWPVALRVLAGLAIVALVAIVFGQTHRFGFINSDDPEYVVSNSAVNAGVTWRGVVWAFTSFHSGNWHPLTWLSHMLDVQVFGLNAGAHHLVNVVLHAANALLVAWFFARTTGDGWRSALVGALFAVHPLHVESVAWVAERKDLLSTLFGLLALLAYRGYAAAPGALRYVAVAIAFAASLASKPMLVTLPVLLLLVDGWPLRRTETWRRLLAEKLPLLALSAASSVVTVLAQARGGALGDARAFPIGARLANALVSCAGYLGHAFWPQSLAAAYPHPALTSEGLPTWRVIAAATALGAITAAVLWQRRRRPWLAFGWLWFLVGLAPVIGIVQVGLQGMADRYTYLPLVGIFAALSWAIPERVLAMPRRRAIAAGVASAALIAAAAVSFRQTGYWRDSVTLFEHAVAVTSENATALRNLGGAYGERGDLARAVETLRESVRLGPWDAFAWMDLGIALSESGRDAEAGRAFFEAVRRCPNDPQVLFSIGMFALRTGRPQQAREVHARLAMVDRDLAGKLAEIGGF